MVLTVQRASEILTQSLGVSALSKVSPNEVINYTLGWLESANDWNYLTTGQAQLPLVADQPFVPLPLDVKHVTGYSATRALVNTFSFTTLHEIIRLRAQRTVTSQLHFWGALEYVPAAGTNLLVRTEDFSAAEWTTIPGASVAVIVKNQSQGPLNDEVTADQIHQDDAVGGLEHVQQNAGYVDLASGDYTFSAYMRDDTTVTRVDGGAGVETFSQLKVFGGGAQTVVDVDWSSSPPSVSLAAGMQTGTNASNADRFGISIEANGWVRVHGVITYDKTEGSGALGCALFPMKDAGDTGAIEAWGAQLERSLFSRYDDIASVSSKLPTTYQAERVSRRRSGVPRRFSFALWPTPTADSVGQGDISIVYDRQFTRVSNDCDYVDIPDYLEGIFLQALLLAGRGWEESDRGFPFERLQGLHRSDEFMLAMESDGMAVPSVGGMVNTHVNQRGGYIQWDTGKTSALP